ncbi:MAG: glycosyl transferase, partial [Nitrospiraceae bacterium]
MIYFIVFICGAVVMSFEILGSRILAPNFGNS